MMLDDEKQLIQALRREIDGPAPAVHTQLSDIVPRGLRRRRIRQASSIAAAVSVVVGLGFAATAIDGQPLSNEPAKTPVIEIPTTVPLTANWSRADKPALEPQSTWTPPPGQPPIPGIPATGRPQCGFAHTQPGPDPTPALMAPEDQRLLAESLREVVGPTAEVAPVVVQPESGGGAVYWLNVTGSTGSGSVRVWAYTNPATPLETADYQVYDENVCLPPKRVVRPDGAVMQIYDIRPTNTVVAQTMKIYLPDHRMYLVMAQNYLPSAHRGPGEYSITRPGPVLTEYQLAQFGEKLTP
jgi:hypothetical protein